MKHLSTRLDKLERDRPRKTWPRVNVYLGRHGTPIERSEDGRWVTLFVPGPMGEDHEVIADGVDWKTLLTREQRIEVDRAADVVVVRYTNDWRGQVRERERGQKVRWADDDEPARPGDRVIQLRWTEDDQ